ncbi:hypothetical protein BDZ89DRAFT_1035280 [Hymenopellis radicata]|nr:hypothetical protein BDZ89DRAFT_1035280 [Hymenopellis radicata]
MVQAFVAFMDFCYLVRRTDFTEDTLAEIDAAVEHFHDYREIFIETGVRDNFNLPHQHAISHYWQNIVDFGAPNGLCLPTNTYLFIICSSKPWRRSSWYKALSQMLLTNQHLDKLHAHRVELVDLGLLEGNHAPVPDPFDEHREDEGPLDGYVTSEVKLAAVRERASRYSRKLGVLARQTKYPELPELLRGFLYDQLRSADDPPSEDVDADQYPTITSRIYIYHSAVAAFYALSDVSGIRGMKCERIRSTPSWGGHPRRDTAFVVVDETQPGFAGLDVMQIMLLLSLKHGGVEYPCALVYWFKKTADRPDDVTGMWVVEPDYHRRRPMLTVVHLDAILRGSHLIPVYGPQPVPVGLHYSNTLNCFDFYYQDRVPIRQFSSLSCLMLLYRFDRALKNRYVGAPEMAPVWGEYGGIQGVWNSMVD